MNKIGAKGRAKILHCLVEGNSMRATSRLCGVSINTVSKLHRDAGWWSIQKLDDVMNRLPFTHIQCDEITSIVRGRRKNLPERARNSDGEVYTWLAIDPHSKLVFAWHIGGRTRLDANNFLQDVYKRVISKPYIATDAYAAYSSQIGQVFGDKQKHCVMKKGDVYEKEGKKVHTSYIERMNGTIRGLNARFRRRSNTISKTIHDHNLSLAVTLMYYNFCRKHGTLKMTPAMMAGLCDEPWSLENICASI